MSGQTGSTTQEETLQITESGVWYGNNIPYHQAAVLIVNDENMAATIQKVTIRGIESEWNDIYYWKGEIGSVSTLSPAQTNLTGTSMEIVVDGKERTFQQAIGNIVLEGFKTLVLFIRNAGNISAQDSPEGNVTIAIFTERNVYLKESSVTYTGTTQQAGFIPYKANVAFSAGTITIDIGNSGTSSGQIVSIYIGTSSSALVNQTSASLPKTIAAGAIESFAVTYTWTAYTTCYFRVVPNSGAPLEFQATSQETIEFMQTEQLTITNVNFRSSSSGKESSITVTNTGTSPFAINTLLINNVEQSYTPQIVEANEHIIITVAYDWISGNAYQFKLVTSKGTPFSYNAIAP